MRRQAFGRNAGRAVVMVTPWTSNEELRRILGLSHPGRCDWSTGWSETGSLSAVRGATSGPSRLHLTSRHGHARGFADRAVAVLRPLLTPSTAEEQAALEQPPGQDSRVVCNYR